MSSDMMDRSQQQLDAEDAELELRRITALHGELGELKTEQAQLRARLRAVKTRIRDLGYDLQHRLDQAGKKRVRVRDQQRAAEVAAAGEKKKGKAKG